MRIRRRAVGRRAARHDAEPAFAVRLLLAQALLLMATAVTCWLVASTLAPGVFRAHLQHAGLPVAVGENPHIEEAFTASMLISLLLALAVAVVVALFVTWRISRRIQGSIAAVVDSATQVAAGRYTTRVPNPGLGREFHRLTVAFNSLAERLDEVETTRRRMLADLAHEMRTPLATLDAHLEAVEDQVRSLDPPTLAVLRSNTHRLTRLAQDIDAVSRAQEGTVAVEQRATTPADLLSSAARTAQARYQAKGVGLDVSARTESTLSVDRERMGQVLGNLLDNALRHTPAGGRVLLAADAVDAWVELVVQDSGEGIPADHLGHVFDRFYRGDTARTRSQGGSGIGLTISRALVEAHGGTISASSGGPGHGATFTVRLPAMPVESQGDTSL